MTKKKGFMARPRGYIVVIVPPVDKIRTEYYQKMPNLETMQRLVGGPIETVPYLHKMQNGDMDLRRGVAYCNEEGWLHRLPENPRAHLFWRASCPDGDPERMHIAGTMIFICKEPISVKTG